MHLFFTVNCPRLSKVDVVVELENGRSAHGYRRCRRGWEQRGGMKGRNAAIDHGSRVRQGGMIAARAATEDAAGAKSRGNNKRPLPGHLVGLLLQRMRPSWSRLSAPTLFVVLPLLISISYMSRSSCCTTTAELPPE